ncbi:hypothetical protein B0H16DRAFT_1884197 [Mycena metata]|uniref:Uncharacterized protein n=1 Tax=Mycena metata TaxID=1033252 RepID=A0AAD7NJ23_9AGAR|nr:hypothetical protein B0H16DRAFT_1884197 [Mycena metata]
MATQEVRRKLEEEEGTGILGRVSTFMHTAPSNTAVPHPAPPTADPPTPRGILLFEYHVLGSGDMAPAADSSSTGIQKGATTHECTTTSFRTARPARRRHILLVVQVRGGMHTCSADATSKTDWAARLAPNRRCFRQQPTPTHPSASCLNGAHALPHRHPKVPMTCTRQCGAPNRCVLLHSSCIARVRTTTKYGRIRIRITPPHPVESLVFLDRRDGETGEGEGSRGC